MTCSVTLRGASYKFFLKVLWWYLYVTQIVDHYQPLELTDQTALPGPRQKRTRIKQQHPGPRGTAVVDPDHNNTDSATSLGNDQPLNQHLRTSEVHGPDVIINLTFIIFIFFIYENIKNTFTVTINSSLFSNGRSTSDRTVSHPYSTRE